MHQLGFTRKPPKLGGIRKVLIALNPQAFERTDPVGRIGTGRSCSDPAGVTGGVGPGWQDGSWQL